MLLSAIPLGEGLDQDINGKGLAKRAQTVFESRPTVLGLVAADQRPAHTAADDVVGTGPGGVDDGGAGDGHDRQGTVYTDLLQGAQWRWGRCAVIDE